ncbi:MAG: reverse transcriptase domain-containing protein, partial [Pseudomonadota bacterium]
MKRHGNLWPQVTSKENLELAHKKARRGKSRMYNVQRFEANREANLERIRRALVDKTFTTSPYQEKRIFEPKERTIYVLPFAPDRIVQHALMNVLEPIWEGLFIHHSYACRPGKGQHAGSRVVSQLVRKHRYCLKCDISKFYPSVDHQILLEIIERKIKCPDTLWLLRDIINSMPG